jgi:hypothetical protein
MIPQTGMMSRCTVTVMAIRIRTAARRMRAGSESRSA